MATLRVRFSGLCLFHRLVEVKKAEVGVWIVSAHNHEANLWVDSETVDTTHMPDVPSPYCFVEENENKELVATSRKVHKFQLGGGEVLSFVGGQQGPKILPGLVSLKKLHRGVGNLKEVPPLEAVVRLNRGGFSTKRVARGAGWHDVPGGGSTPNSVRLWTDLVVHGLDHYELESRPAPGEEPTRTWKFSPKTETTREMRVWIGSHSQKDTHDPQSGEHFRHLFSACDIDELDAPARRPYPKLDEEWPCSKAVTKSMELWPPLTVGSTFCPDGQYP